MSAEHYRSPEHLREWLWELMQAGELTHADAFRLSLMAPLLHAMWAKGDGSRHGRYYDLLDDDDMAKALPLKGWERLGWLRRSDGPSFMSVTPEGDAVHTMDRWWLTDACPVPWPLPLIDEWRAWRAARWAEEEVAHAQG